MDNIECPSRNRLQADIEACALGAYDFDALKDSKILITGATGLVGGFLTRVILCANRIRGLNALVLAPVRSMQKARTALDGVIGRADLRVFEADITQSFHVDEDVDYIVHAAGVTKSKLFVTQPVETLSSTFRSADTLLSLAVHKKTRGMVYVSSMEAFGTVSDGLNGISEHELGYVDIRSPRSCYPEGKRAAECLSAAYAHEYGLNVRIARLAQTFGAGVSADETRVFMQFARSALKGENIVLHTKGESYGNYVYLADCASALLMLLTRGERGEAYTVVNESACVNIKTLARVACDALSDKPLDIVFDIPSDNLKYGYAPDVKMRLRADKIAALGWQPTVGLRDMFIGMAADMKEQQLLI